MLLESDSDKLGKIVSISGVYLVNVTTEPLLYVLTTLTEWACKVSDNIDAVLFAENLIVENSGLLVVRVRVLVRVSTDCSADLDF